MKFLLEMTVLIYFFLDVDRSYKLGHKWKKVVLSGTKWCGVVNEARV